MRITTLLYAILFTVLTSCGSTKDADILTEEEVQIPGEATPSKIVFLYFDIVESVDGLDKITLTENQVVDGQLKENTILNAPRKAGNLILQITDNNGEIQEEQIIENPLNQNIEQYGESGEMNSQNVELEKSQFYMRFNQQKDSKSIVILKILPSKNVELFNQAINL